jgi:hypothetical protein
LYSQCGVNNLSSICWGNPETFSACARIDFLGNFVTKKKKQSIGDFGDLTAPDAFTRKDIVNGCVERMEEWWIMEQSNRHKGRFNALWL